MTGPACPPAGQGTVCVAVDLGDVDGDGDGVDGLREVGGAHCGDLVAEL